MTQTNVRFQQMRRHENPQWLETCRRVDKAAEMLEQSDSVIDETVWAARDMWAAASRGWMDGTVGIADVAEAAARFADAALAATPAGNAPNST